MNHIGDKYFNINMSWRFIIQNFVCQNLRLWNLILISLRSILTIINNNRIVVTAWDERIAVWGEIYAVNTVCILPEYFCYSIITDYIVCELHFWDFSPMFYLDDTVGFFFFCRVPSIDKSYTDTFDRHRIYSCNAVCDEML